MCVQVYGTPDITSGQAKWTLEAASFIKSDRPTGTDYHPSILIKTWTEGGKAMGKQFPSLK